MDGRRPGELRKIDCQLGVVEGADGSCMYRQGHTSIIASVIGPYEASGKQRSNKTDASIDVEFVVSSFAGSERKEQVKGTRANKEAAMFIQQTFAHVIQTEFTPSSHIQISVNVLTNHGSSLACAINAVTLACMHAALPMKDLVFATTGTVVDTVPFLDLNAQERGIAGTQVTLALTHTEKAIITLQSESRISVENLSNVVDLMTSGCEAVGTVCKDFMRKHVATIAATVSS